MSVKTNQLKEVEDVFWSRDVVAVEIASMLVVARLTLELNAVVTVARDSCKVEPMTSCAMM